MKTTQQKFLFTVVTLGVLSVIVWIVLEKKLTDDFVRKTQNTEVPQSNLPTPSNTLQPQKESKSPRVVTKDTTLLKGEGRYYFKDGALYKDLIENGAVTKHAQKIVEGVDYVTDQNEYAFLFEKSTDDTDLHGTKNELWLFDKHTGEVALVAQGVLNAHLSPSGKLVGVEKSDNELLVVNQKGETQAKIGVHGSSPVFSPDETKIAYIKLSDQNPESLKRDPALIQGVALYDLVTGKDKILTRSSQGNEGGDYGVRGWSPDGQRIYFVSDRNDYSLPASEFATTWSVGIEGNYRRQETNKDSSAAPNSIPQIGGDLWVNAQTLVSEGDGVWVSRFGADGAFINAKKVAGKNMVPWSLQWNIKARSIMFREIKDGKSEWVIMDVPELLK